jgi:hypothetical protein
MFDSILNFFKSKNDDNFSHMLSKDLSNDQIKYLLSLTNKYSIEEVNYNFFENKEFQLIEELLPIEILYFELQSITIKIDSCENCLESNRAFVKAKLTNIHLSSQTYRDFAKPEACLIQLLSVCKKHSVACAKDVIITCDKNNRAFVNNERFEL